MLYSSLPASLDIGTFVTPTEQKIVDLSTKVIAMQGDDGFEVAIRELRAGIREHIESARNRLAAFRVANDSDSKVAD
ncbi:MAG: hypothetical protein DMG96_28190 [Acidobacteria bacterium]|nr:MAG: hypothetical protein DMG96_28190 [Acidobacteriota bacterium]